MIEKLKKIFYNKRIEYWNGVAGILVFLLAVFVYFFPPGVSNDVDTNNSNNEGIWFDESTPETTYDEMPAPSDNGDTSQSALRYRIEGLLADQGFFKGIPSGEETLDSREAIRQAEIELGLSVDGLPDRTLLRVLRSREGDSQRD